MFTMSYFLRVFCLAATLIYALHPSAVVRCFSMYQQPSVMQRIAKSVLADDMSWLKLINAEIKINWENLDEHIISMLNELGFVEIGSSVRAQPILRHLATDRGVTGSELSFGIKVMGTAIFCHFAKTVYVLNIIIAMYSVRPKVTVKSVQEYASKLQMLMVKYVDKLAAFDEPIDFFLKTIGFLNETFMRMKGKLEEKMTPMIVLQHYGFSKIRAESEDILKKKCTNPKDVQNIAKSVSINHLNTTLFTKDFRNVDTHQIVAMIDLMDSYEYVEFSSLGVDYWQKKLEVFEYKARVIGKFNSNQ
ncbi:Hypothetical protein CINCED_3A014648 [Cinara cedri]|uniref:Uncharacterized protein n=1 Tax=Cinara cedri TaxID=506608 RepID=A0A5E4N5S0_9HEMI|nr:Hypothetical protein CINCED_3A014648 [Cinara cedri]